MAVLGEIGRGTTPRFNLKTTANTGELAAMDLTILSGDVRITKTLNEFAAYVWYAVTVGAGDYIFTKWLFKEPTADSEMADVPSNWIGVYAGDSETAPTGIISYTWYQFGTAKIGDTIYIKWAAKEPTADGDMKTTPDLYIGICASGEASAPTAYTAYTWYLYKGNTSGSSDHIYTKWLDDEPILDSDLSDTPNAWVGIYVGSSSTAPTARGDYTWYQYTGEDMPATYAYVKYAEELPTSDGVLTDEYDENTAYIGIYAGPSAPDRIKIDDTYNLHVSLSQAETLLLSDEVTYQYHYRLTNEEGGTDGYTGSSRIYRRTVRELLSGTSI